MLGLFAATVHGNYAKAMRVYLQQMYSLPDTHPWLHEQFMKGRHSIRRSDRYWSGLSCDLVIEVTMMRSIKGRGGLTRGRGIHETVRTVWVNTVRECDTDSDPESCSCLDADNGMSTSVLVDDDVDWEIEETVIS